jgi:hypothetical protein
LDISPETDCKSRDERLHSGLPSVPDILHSIKHAV